MESNTIDAKMLSKMFLAGAINLERKKEWINELNVFPVPDGDTGTNMTMTIMTAAREVVELGDSVTMETLCKAISGGSLRGARGNSGVILSQLFRGFTRGTKSHDFLTIPIIADAFERAVETAYKAVMKPKEGTILTVARGVAVKARELTEARTEDLNVFFVAILEQARLVLSQTPEMLPVLKQAGVVDSGGQGLVEVLSGAFDAFSGKEVDLDFIVPKETLQLGINVNASYKAQAEAEITFGYCTEFIIMLNRIFNIKNEMDFKGYLESIGDSIVCVADDDVVKVHVHTNDPGLVLQKALKYGTLSNIKIDNMRLEHQEKLFKMSEKEKTGKGVKDVAPIREVGFIAVSIGEGINEIFKSLGVDYIIEGGQTMNPSTADILDAVDKVNAGIIFILPNNKNIILAANQAAELVTEKNLFVIPTKTIPQGITAVINYVPELSVDENEATMMREISSVKTGQVTYAVRDTQINDKAIKQGDYMGIADKGILAVGQDMAEVTAKMVAEMINDTSELISIYYGCDVEESSAQQLCDSIKSAYSNCDVELQYGGQPIYYYVISVE